MYCQYNTQNDTRINKLLFIHEIALSAACWQQTSESFSATSLTDLCPLCAWPGRGHRSICTPGPACSTSHRRPHPGHHHQPAKDCVKIAFTTPQCLHACILSSCQSAKAKPDSWQARCYSWRISEPWFQFPWAWFPLIMITVSQIRAGRAKGNWKTFAYQWRCSYCSITC